MGKTHTREGEGKTHKGERRGRNTQGEGEKHTHTQGEGEKYTHKGERRGKNTQGGEEGKKHTRERGGEKTNTHGGEEGKERNTQGRVRDEIDEINREVNSATLTLRELQRQMEVLRTRLSVLNSTDNSLSDGAECGDSASGEDEFNEGNFEHRPWTNFGPMYNGVGMDSVNKHHYFRKRMCRFGSRCWRPHCWFHHGNGDRMKQIVNMAHYWTQEVERLSACTAATETVHRANIDEIQTDIATAPVDPSLAAPRAATASPSAPVSVIEHATLAPVDVYTKPAPVIDLMPALVIEYIAPSVAVSSSSFFPSFDQIHEAVTDSENPQFSITADETSQMSMERIQEQSAVSDLVTSVESSPVVDSVPLLHAVEYIMLESRVPAPQIQEQVIVQEIPGAQVEERIQKQIAETIPQECVRRTVEQNVRTSVPTPAQMPKSLDRWLRKFELQNEEDEYLNRGDLNRCMRTG